jgi:hypothetical protein
MVKFGLDSNHEMAGIAWDPVLKYVAVKTISDLLPDLEHCFKTSHFFFS